MKRTLPLLSANLLYAVTMLLVLTAGSFIQARTLTWGLIATEVFLIALPTVLLLRQQRVPLRAGLRLGPISPLTGILCLVLGAAMYLFGLLIEGIMAQLTGPRPVDIPSNLLPTTTIEMVVYFIGLAIAAPVCEEMLFRGAIQGSYEARKMVRLAIGITALMFAFYHFRVSGLPALLPIAFVLGYVAWRTQSIYAAMLVHFGNNATAGLQNILFFTTGKGLPFVGLGSALAGLVVAAIILFVIHRRIPAAPHTPRETAGTPELRPWLATYWPLVVAGLLYVGVGALNLAATLTPRFQAAADAAYGFPSVRAPVASVYAITNQGGQPVGEMACTLRPQGAYVRLDCTRTIRAYEYKTGNSFYKDGNHTDTISAAWDGKTMALVDFLFERGGEEGSVITSAVKDGTLTTTDSSGANALTLPENALVEFEWAWHAALLKANTGEAFSMPFARLMMWDESKKKSVPLLKTEVMGVGNEEVLSLPSGDVTTRKLTLANLAAWYATHDAVSGLPRPVRFNDGVLIYTMTS